MPLPSAGDTVEGVRRDDDRHVRLRLQPVLEPVQERAATGEHDALFSMMSAASSGGVRSSVTLTASTMADTGSSMALRISSVVVTTVFGRPVTRSRPRISA